MVAQSMTTTSPGPRGAELGESAESRSARWVAAALEAALKARAPAIHASTPLVVHLARRVGRELGLDEQSQSLLEMSVRVRDIGMLSLPYTVVLVPESLTPADWELVHRHPILGAELVEGLSPLAAASQIIRAHHERWDGEGYPDGLRGDAIPLLSRVIAICDTFVAIASDRPHRRRIGTDSALDQIRLERGRQFDPRIADTFVAMVAGRSGGGDEVGGHDGNGATGRPRGRAPRPAGGRRDLADAIAGFDVVPAFAPACEQALAATDANSPTASEIVAAIESDTGLTLAILRKAQTGARRPIATVPDAVAALSAGEIRDAIRALPRTQFPWQTSPLEVLMHNSRIHAQAVTRAADRIAREGKSVNGDDLLTAALLHDVGKLAFSGLGPQHIRDVDVRRTSPEDRARTERRALGIDHASLGGALLLRWGLPEALANAVAAHHTSEDPDEFATYVRLADMLAHHAQGHTIDRAIMLRVAHACELSTKGLRDVMFELPRTGGSLRRRAERSPLSPRETQALRLLARGKLYRLIAVELNLTESTVRTHLHNTYRKLGVADRAQAVLRATEMGWI